MNTAVITGVTGQDGSYLAEFLLHRGWRIVGAVRDQQEAVSRLADSLRGEIELVNWDMCDQAGMEAIFRQYKPSEIYNFAACSSGAGMFDDVQSIGDINGIAVTRMLEAIRSVDPGLRFCQASSSEMFGHCEEVPQHEKSRFQPRSPYGAAKLYAHNMINIYRQHYGLFACSAILFNHESPRRGQGFVTRKITRLAAKIKLGLAHEIRLGRLDSRRDWGYAGDYVQAMHAMLQAEVADDYVIATGQTHSVRELCEIAFCHLGLDYRDYVREDIDNSRVSERFQLVGDATRIRQNLGWTPTTGFDALVTNMVDADLASLKFSKKNETEKSDG